MKIIEAMKEIKELQKKAEDLRGKVKKHCAISNIQTPEYEDQRKQVAGWVQSHDDILKEILRLRVAIQKTNLNTKVDIELGGKTVKKTIAEWIHRRRDLARTAWEMYSGLTDRGIREGESRTPEGDVVNIKIIRFYDPEARDKMVDLYVQEPFKIDARLEVINAVTDIVE